MPEYNCTDYTAFNRVEGEERSNILDTQNDGNSIEQEEWTKCLVTIANEGENRKVEVPYGETILDKLPVLSDKEFYVFDGYEINGVKLAADITATSDVTSTPKYKSKMILPGKQFNTILKQLISESGFTGKKVTFRATYSSYETIVTANPNATYYDVSEEQDRSTLMCKELGGGLDICIFSIYGDIYFNTDSSYMFSNTDVIGKFQSNYQGDHEFITKHVENMSYMFYYCSGMSSAEFSKFRTDSCKSMCEMFAACTSLTTLDLTSFSTQNVESFNSFLSTCSKLTTVKIDNNKFNTGNATTLRHFANQCENLVTIDVSSFDTSKVSDFDRMFSNCNKLTAINVSKWDTSSAVIARFMFYECNNIKTLNVSNFNTVNLVDATSMFEACYSLSVLDVSKWNVQSIQYVTRMFRRLDCVTVIDVSGWRPQNIKDVAACFDLARAVKTLDVSGWNVSQCDSFYAVFSQCFELTSLKLGFGWNAPNVTNMQWMFNSTKLTTLDISMLDSRKCQNFNWMFGKVAGSSWIKIIYGTNFLPVSGTSFTDMYPSSASANVHPNWDAYGTWSGHTFVKK